MKIAFCLYGQPRNYKKGYEVFKAWLNVNDISMQDVDFFFHAWTLKPGDSYHASTYRDISATELEYNMNMQSDLLDLYHPVKHGFEEQKSPDSFPVEYIRKSMAYRNISPEKSKMRDFMPNVLSQLYSLYCVHGLCKRHIETSGTKYDCIVVSRFDFQSNLNRIRLRDWDYTKKVILPENHYPRKLVSGSLIIMPPAVFLVWMGMYKDLDKLVNNMRLYRTMQNMGEMWHFNTEEIYTAAFLYYFRANLSNIVYIQPAIWFAQNVW